MNFISHFSMKRVELIRIFILALPEEEMEDVCLSNVFACCLGLNYDNCDVKLQMVVYIT
jgi:hypothetical protein